MAKTIVESVTQAPSLKTFTVAVRAAFLLGALTRAGPYTVFAPNNDAFAALPVGTLDRLFEERTQLAEVIAYHIACGRIMSGDMASARSARTLYGQTLPMAASDGDVLVDGAHLLQPDFECTNGVIHVIDVVLLPAMRMAA